MAKENFYTWSYSLTGYDGPIIQQISTQIHSRFLKLKAECRFHVRFFLKRTRNRQMY